MTDIAENMNAGAKIIGGTIPTIIAEVRRQSLKDALAAIRKASTYATSDGTQRDEAYRSGASTAFTLAREAIEQMLMESR